MLASKLFVVVLAIGVTVWAKPFKKTESFDEDTASEIKHIKDELKELKDHPEDAAKGEKIKALIDEVQTLKDDVIEKKKEQEIEKDVKVEKEEVDEAAPMEDAVVANYKNEIQRIRTALEDPKTAKNKELMAILKDEAKHVQFEVQQKIKENNEKKKKDEVPEVIVPEEKDAIEMKDEEIHLENEDEEQLDAGEIETKREAEAEEKKDEETILANEDQLDAVDIETKEKEEAEDAAIEFKKDMKDKLLQIHDHLQDVKTYLEEKKKDAQMDGEVMNAGIDAKPSAVEQYDEGVRPILPEQAMPSHDALVAIKERLQDIKTRIEENPIKDENVKRAVALKLHEIKEKLRDMVSGNPEGLEMIDAKDAPVIIPKENIKLEDAPKPASVKQALADSMIRIKGKLLKIRKELLDTPITDKNVKKDVADKLHMIHDKLADVASAMTIPADTPEGHQNPLAELHGIREKLLDVKAKLLEDPITDEAEKEAVKRSLEKIHQKLSDFAGKIEVHAALVEDDAPKNEEIAMVETKDAAPAPVRLDEKLHIIKQKMVAIRDELKANPTLLEDPATKKVVEEKLEKIRSRMRDFAARSGVNAALVEKDTPEKKEVNDAPLKLKLHDIKNRLLHMKDVLESHPIKDAAVKEQVEKRLEDIHQKLRDVAANMGVDKALSEVEKADAPEKEEIVKPKPAADAHLKKLDIKLVKVKLDHIREMMKDHPITNDAVKDAVKEKLNHIQKELKDYAQRNFDVELDEKVNDETADKVEVGEAVEVEKKEDDKVQSDGEKLKIVHAKLDQIRRNLIEHPVKDASIKKAVEERLHIIKDKLADYAVARGYDVTTELEKDNPVPAKKEDAKEVEVIADAPVPAPVKEAEMKHYDALEERLKQIKDELATNPIKDENTRAAVDSKLQTIEAKLSDMQQTADEVVSEKKEEVVIQKPELKKDALKEKLAEEKVKVVVPEDVPEKKVEAIELPAITEDEVKEVPAVVEDTSTKDQEQKAKKDELEEHLSKLKDEMAELKKEYADLSEEKVVKDEKKTEKSQAANDVITDWEAELDAIHDE